MIVGSIDVNNLTEDEDGNPMFGGIAGTGVEAITQAFDINEIDPGEADYAANPFWGFTPDDYTVVVDKDLEWQLSSFYRDDHASPMVQLVTLVGAAHSNADYMATIAWDFLKSFTREADGSLGELG